MRPLAYLAHLVAIYRRGRPFDTSIVTRFVKADFRYAHRRDWNFIAVFEGAPGEGKSEASFWCGKFWTRLRDSELHYTWDIDKIPKMGDGDHIHIDEWIIPEGPGKIQALNRLWNLWTTWRVRNISATLATPSAPQLEYITFLGTALAQNFSSEANLFEIRVFKPRHGLVYIGNALFPLHDDDEFRAIYERESYARKLELSNKKGKKEISFGGNAEEIAEKALKYAAERGWQVNTLGNAKGALKSAMDVYEWDLNYDDIATVANIMQMTAQNQIKRDIPAYKGQTADLQNAVCNRMIERGYETRKVEALRLRITKRMSQDDIALKLDVSQPTISNWLKSGDLKREMGEAFEDVYSAMLTEKEIEHEIFGANSPEPDCVIYENNEPIEVRSLKCFISKRRVTSIQRGDIGKAEKQLAVEKEIPLRLIFYNIWTDNLHEAIDEGQQTFTFHK